MPDDEPVTSETKALIDALSAQLTDDLGSLRFFIHTVAAGVSEQRQTARMEERLTAIESQLAAISAHFGIVVETADV